MPPLAPLAARICGEIDYEAWSGGKVQKQGWWGVLIRAPRLFFLSSLLLMCSRVRDALQNATAQSAGFCGIFATELDVFITELNLLPTELSFLIAELRFCTTKLVSKASVKVSCPSMRGVIVPLRSLNRGESNTRRRAATLVRQTPKGSACAPTHGEIWHVCIELCWPMSLPGSERSECIECLRVF